MDPIDLARSLPARQQAKLYAQALRRLASPAVAWPAWLALCGFLATAAMAEAWKRLAPSLPPLGASDILLGAGMMLPALALDALLRKASPLPRSKTGYALAPLAAIATVCLWLALGAQPLARHQALAARAVEASAQADALLAQARQLAGRGDAGLAASQALRMGLGRPRSMPPHDLARPAPLPPLPMGPGHIGQKTTARRDADAADEAGDARLESAAKAASSMLSSQALLDHAAASLVAQQARGVASQLRRPPAPLNSAQAGPERRILLGAMAASWLGAPIGSLGAAHGLARSLSSVLSWLFSIASALWPPIARRMRPAASRLLAPSEAHVAELRRMVAAYAAAQQAYPGRASPNEAPAPVLDDLSVSLHLSARASGPLARPDAASFPRT